MRFRCLALAGLLATLAAPAARADASCDRQCRIEAANMYLAALVHHDGSQVPFHEDVQRYENGGNTGNGAADTREALGSPIMYVITGIRDLRWYVDGDHAVAVYFLDTVTSPTYIFERFEVGADGLIREIEAIFYIDITGYMSGPESFASRPDGQVERFTASSHGPLGPMPVQPGNTGDDAARTPADRGVVADAVGAYLDAMASHDASGVPFADASSASVNRRPVDDPAASLEADNGITAIEGAEIYVDGEQAIAMYEIVTGEDRSDGAARFRVVDGQIAEVEAVCDSTEFCTA